MHWLALRQINALELPLPVRLGNPNSLRSGRAVAKICMRQARDTKSRQVAAELRRMAKDYQKRAAELNSGKLPDLRD